MQSYDLKSPTKRLGVSLNVDTGYKGKQQENSSPPVTPPSKQQMRGNTNNAAGRGSNAAASRALRRTGPRETFLDDITPIDGSMMRENEDKSAQFRDSHDLSLHPRQITRDSLVDNMLLSLDQYSFDRDLGGSTMDNNKPYAPFAEENPYVHQQNFAPRNNRSLSHSYSYSSDYENNEDGARYSGQINRSRRSNSSSNFQSGLGRINSLRNDGGINQGFAARPGSKGPPVQIPPRGLHSRSGKGSKASSANSLDLGYQSPSAQRWGHGLGGRSSSFDYGADKQSSSAHANIMNRQINTSASYAPYDYDAAPTPTVPGGPSRPRPTSPIFSSRPPTASADAIPPRIERRRSTRSAKGGLRANKNGSTSSAGRPDYGLHDDSRELPPMPAFVKDTSPAPAPHVGYEKAKQATPAPKERPGFFRRLFGSSSGNHAAALPDPPRSHGSATSVETGDRPNSKSKQIASQMKSQQTVPSREAPPVPQQPTLTKKPSSFFRRRKKSVSETEPPVPVPALPRVNLTPEKQATIAKPPPSPVSSLRQVMNPYIRTPQKSAVPERGYDGIDRDMSNSPEPFPRVNRGFSPDYEPDPIATIRPVKTNSRDANSRENNDRVPSSHSTHQKGLLTTELAGQSKHFSHEHDATFLQDASDNDQDSVSTRSKTIPSAKTNAINALSLRSRSTSPVVERDMALVAEYERNHARQSPAPNAAKQTSPTPKHKPSPISTKRSKSTLKPSSPQQEKKEFIVITPTKTTSIAKADDRVWLEPSSSEDEVVTSSLNVPPQPSNASQLTSSSTDTVYKSAMSTALPIVQIDGQDAMNDDDDKEAAPRLMTASEAIKALDELVAKEEAKEVSDSDRERAQQLYDGIEDLVAKDKAAAWLGEDGNARAKTLLAYMALYDFSNLNILAALRVMCGRLVLRAESQQVDRILDAFATRWCACNSNHGFQVTDVVHTICYSLLLLNTDLHMADIEQKMTRSQFVKNTMPTIRRSVQEGAPDAFDSARPSVLPGKGSAFDNESSTNLGKASVDLERPSWRSSFRPPPRVDANGNVPTALDFDTPTDDCGPLVKAPFHGTLRTWEVQVEVVLKDFYNSIRAERLPLFGAPVEKSQPQSTNNLSVFSTGVLRRSPSVLSKTPSEAHSYGPRGRTADSVKMANSKWATKNRSRPRLYPGSSGLGSSRTSLDDQSSIWSPSVSSSTWSKYSLGKTHTSMSVDSFGSTHPQGDYQSSIGFANALSQAIIREEHVGTSGSGGSDREELRVAPLLEDESLELHGAPWAKEGIVKHKHHLEAMDRKSKNRDWNEVFAVIEKGYMSLFSFSSKSMKKSRGKAAGGVVGGGNWQENAESLGSFLLRQTIASALPSPGYSKTRPHVWALSLPTGAVHLFQVGTADIIKEFVTTANYWSARLSNHPLVGGISNIEYGWSENIINNALVTAINESTSRPRASSSGQRPSLQSSLRSSLDQGMTGAIRSRLPGDKITISDWSPPTQSMRASNLMEPDQLSTLRAYVAGIEDELQKHNQLRSPMLLAFTPRHPNAQKAMANWEKKSSYLLREIVKFRTYIDSLHAAEKGKQEIYLERAERRRMVLRGSDDEEEGDVTLRAA